MYFPCHLLGIERNFVSHLVQFCIAVDTECKQSDMLLDPVHHSGHKSTLANHVKVTWQPSQKPCSKAMNTLTHIFTPSLVYKSVHNFTALFQPRCQEILVLASGHLQSLCFLCLQCYVINSIKIKPTSLLSIFLLNFVAISSNYVFLRITLQKRPRKVTNFFFLIKLMSDSFSYLKSMLPRIVSSDSKLFVIREIVSVIWWDTNIFLFCKRMKNVAESDCRRTSNTTLCRDCHSPPFLYRICIICNILFVFICRHEMLIIYVF